MHVCIVFIWVKHKSKYKLSDEYYFLLNISIPQIKDFWTYNMKNFSAVYYWKFKWHTWKTPPQPYILNIAKSTVCSGCRSGPWVVPRTFSEQEQHPVDSGFHRRLEEGDRDVTSLQPVLRSPQQLLERLHSTRLLPLVLAPIIVRGHYIAHTKKQWSFPCQSSTKVLLIIFAC